MNIRYIFTFRRIGHFLCIKFAFCNVEHHGDSSLFMQTICIMHYAVLNTTVIALYLCKQYALCIIEHHGDSSLFMQTICIMQAINHTFA